MGKLSLNGKDLRKIGYPESKVIGVAIQVMHQYYKHSAKEDALEILLQVLEQPEKFREDGVLQKIALVLLDELYPKNQVIPLSPKRIPYVTYGAENIEQGAISQMEIAMKLPVTVAGALMPDAHHGYGLPIGGVLATENAVIPYGVGVDIGCRMCLSIFDLPGNYLQEHADNFNKHLVKNTLFGSGAVFTKPMDHEVLSRNEFNENKFLKTLHARAAKQIGSSGSGNHFVEFGIVEISEDSGMLHIPPGNYLGLLSHSGSRSLGAGVANYYTRLAMQQCKLPDVAKQLAWLSLDSEEGQEYWSAMNLCGDYASACHDVIHKKIIRGVGAQVIGRVENHHNFAWKEIFNGREVIVHRKGATPAGKGVAGIIPGSMTAPGYIVEGKGEPLSIASASHGAGRKMSRTAAKNSFTHKMMMEALQEAGVTLIGGDLDESPMAYKDIGSVMRTQEDLVNIIGIFKPKLVQMA